MGNIIYYLLDFFRSGPGKFLGVILAILFGIFSFKTCSHRKDAFAENQDDFAAQASKSVLWDADENELSESSDHISVEKPYQRFEPRKRKQLVVIEKAEKKSLNPLPFKPSEDFVILPPLIKSQRSITPEPEKRGTHRARNDSPNINSGTLLHCQLVMPLDTSVSSSPVVARLVKPLIQRGRVVAPVGTQVTGRFRNSQGDRVFLEERWQLNTGKDISLSVKASAMQKQYDAFQNLYGASDGKFGLQGRLADQKDPKSNWKAVAGTLASATGKLAQERVRTVLGDQVPLTARNTLLEGGTALIDKRLGRLESEETSDKPVVTIEAGVEFYLLVEEAELGNKSEPADSGATVDSLLRQALELRFNR